MFNFFKKKVEYDESPKIKSAGIVHIVALFLYDDEGKFVGQHVLTKMNKINDDAILEQDVIKSFIKKFPGGYIKCKDHECELKHYKEKTIFPKE